MKILSTIKKAPWKVLVYCADRIHDREQRLWWAAAKARNSFDDRKPALVYTVDDAFAFIIREIEQLHIHLETANTLTEHYRDIAEKRK